MGSTLVMAGLTVVVWFEPHSREIIRVLPFMWMTLVAFDFVFALSRFEEFLSDALRTAPRLQN